MKLDHLPSFRKAPTPWHDSNLFCALMSVFMAAVFFFARVGFGFAVNNERYESYRWVPLLLMVMSGIVFTTNIVRLLVRLVRRPSEED